VVFVIVKVEKIHLCLCDTNTEREKHRHKHKYIHYTNNKDSGKNINNRERIFAYIEIFVIKWKSF